MPKRRIRERDVGNQFVEQERRREDQRSDDDLKEPSEPERSAVGFDHRWEDRPVCCLGWRSFAFHFAILRFLFSGMKIIQKLSKSDHIRNSLSSLLQTLSEIFIERWHQLSRSILLIDVVNVRLGERSSPAVPNRREEPLEEDLIEKARASLWARIARLVGVGRLTRFLISKTIQNQHYGDKREVRYVIYELEFHPRGEIVAIVLPDYPAQLRTGEDHERHPEDEQQARRPVTFELVVQHEHRGEDLEEVKFAFNR